MEQYDVIIIGASAAGISAAIYLARHNINFLLVSKDFGGEVATAGEIDNYPGLDGTNGIELTERLHKHLKKYNIEPQLYVEVESVIRQNDNLFCVRLKVTNPLAKAQNRVDHQLKQVPYCDFLAKAIIVATGSTPKQLNVPGDKEYRNKGVSYCTVCDGPIFKSKITATIGGGNSALESGLMMAGLAKRHYMINKNPRFKGDAIYVEKLQSAPNVEIIYNAQTAEIFGDGKVVRGIRYLEKATGEIKELEVDGVFVHIGMTPNSSFVPAEVEKHQYGEIKIGSRCQTNISGLFAAGDVTDIPFKQITIAVGQGTVAALSAIEYLNRLNS